MRLNPQLGSPGQAIKGEIKLPSAAQAAALTPEQARAQLLELRRVGATLASSAATPAGSASAAQASASDPAAPAPRERASEALDEASGAMPTAPASAAAPAEPMSTSASGRGLPIDPWMLISVGTALLVILLLAFQRREEPGQPAAPRPATPSQAPAAPKPAEPAAIADSAQGRFRPALPPDQEPLPRSLQSRPPAAGSPEAARPPSGPARLSDLGPLPSLDLDEPASVQGTAVSPEPAGLKGLGPAQAATPAAPIAPTVPASARAPSPGGFDLSRINLDLDAPNKREP